MQPRLIDFYDDLTFKERVTRDDREVWYANYELIAARSYSELRAKKLIVKDLDIEHMFESATQFLFEVKLQVPCDRARKENRALRRWRTFLDRAPAGGCPARGARSGRAPRTKGAFADEPVFLVARTLAPVDNARE